MKQAKTTKEEKQKIEKKKLFEMQWGGELKVDLSHKYGIKNLMDKKVLITLICMRLTGNLHFHNFNSIFFLFFVLFSANCISDALRGARDNRNIYEN